MQSGFSITLRSMSTTKSWKMESTDPGSPAVMLLCQDCLTE